MKPIYLVLFAALLLIDGISTYKAIDISSVENARTSDNVFENERGIRKLQIKVDSLSAFDKKNELLLISIDERLKSVEERLRYVEKKIIAYGKDIDRLKKEIESVQRHETAMTQTAPQRFKLGSDFERLGMFEFAPYALGDLTGDIQGQVIRVKSPGIKMVAVNGCISFSLEKGHILTAQLFFNGVPAYNAGVWDISSDSGQSDYVLNFSDVIRTTGAGDLEIRVKTNGEALCTIKGASFSAEIP